MIALEDPGAFLADRVGSVPGAYASWRLDLVDEQDRGVFVEWAFGGPLVPGFEAASREGSAQLGVERPGLRIVVVDRGVEVFSALHEYAPDQAYRIPRSDHTVMGDCVFGSREEGGRRLVAVKLDCPVPGSEERLTGEIHVEGLATTGLGDEDSFDHIHWAPLLASGRGRAVLRIGGRTLIHFEGIASHQREVCHYALARTGLDYWIKGRFRAEGRAHYMSIAWARSGVPEVRVVSVGFDGVLTPLTGVTVDASQRQRGWDGMPWYRKLVLTRDGMPLASFTLDRVFGNCAGGKRFFAVVRDASDWVSRGLVDVCSPQRIDAGVAGWLTNRRLNRSDGSNSKLLPLLQGETAGRLGRTLQLLAGGEEGVPKRTRS